MIIKKLPLVNLLECAEHLFREKTTPAGPPHPYVYSERVMFKCLIVKAVKRLYDCEALYNYLSHKANTAVRAAVGLAAQLSHVKTFQRHFAASEPLMQRQMRVVTDQLEQAGVISYNILSVDGTLCNALGPVWHQSDRRLANKPEKLRNLDVSAEWGPSGYRGWTYGYSALSLCNAAWNEPAIFVEGWVASANVSETIRLRSFLSQAP